MKKTIFLCILSFLLTAAAEDTPAPAATAPAPGPAAATPAPAKPELTKEQKTAFLEVVGSGHLAKIQEFLNNDTRFCRAEIEENGVVETALSRAMGIQKKQVRILVLEMLLKAGADPNVKTGENSDTVLLLSVRENDLEFFRLFLAFNADFTAKNANGESPASAARRMKDKTMFNAIREAAKKPEIQKREKLKRAAFAAVQKKDLEALKKLMEQGFDIRTRRDDGETVLSLAVLAGSPEIAKFAVENGVPVNAGNMIGMTPVMAALKNNQTEILTYLLSCKADTGIHDRYGMTALMYAATLPSGSAVKAKMLLDAGADANAVDKFGSTALMYAVRRGDEELVRVLLAGGADKTKTDKAGLTPAQMTKDAKILELLK